uniref:Uncharacterized protein n=1 Tax=Setaria viridis TaxID=4556 RepID=A0A4U6U1R9_SETVI|nr:hypothetical protein SEVIR_7G081001v2 [Setaria viridis]
MGIMDFTQQDLLFPELDLCILPNMWTALVFFWSRWSGAAMWWSGAQKFGVECFQTPPIYAYPDISFSTSVDLLEIRFL